MKTSELTDGALDWAVAKCEGYAATIKPTETVYTHPDGQWHHNGNWRPSTNWSQGGPIIEREFIGVRDFMNVPSHMRWRANQGTDAEHRHTQHGPTPLIAAMRCYVAGKLGEEVDVPKELA